MPQLEEEAMSCPANPASATVSLKLSTSSSSWSRSSGELADRRQRELEERDSGEREIMLEKRNRGLGRENKEPMRVLCATSGRDGGGRADESSGRKISPRSGATAATPAFRPSGTPWLSRPFERVSFFYGDRISYSYKYSVMHQKLQFTQYCKLSVVVTRNV